MLKKAVFTMLGVFVFLSLGWAQPEYAPVPDGAKGPAIPETGYLVSGISDGVYWVTNGVYQALIITTGEGVIMVDAPPNIGPNLSKAISDVTSEPVKFFIYSHEHKDHVGAAALFSEDATYVAHEKVAEHLARANDPNRPVPSVTFTDKHTLKLGNKRVELSNKGGNHTPGSSFIHLPEQKILMLVDVVYPGWVPFKSFGEAKDVGRYIEAHDQILEYDFEHFVGGHLTRLGTRRDVEIAKEYVLDVKANAQNAIETVDFSAIAGEVGFENPFALFKTYLDTVADTCTKGTVPKWVDRLGGTDVFTFDHCLSMHFHLTID
jgi:glyoxylase-like metal-dependent hydrolase (beta-lactamase superfamily II)